MERVSLKQARALHCDCNYAVHDQNHLGQCLAEKVFIWLKWCTCYVAVSNKSSIQTRILILADEVDDLWGTDGSSNSTHEFYSRCSCDPNWVAQLSSGKLVRLWLSWPAQAKHVYSYSLIAILSSAYLMDICVHFAAATRSCH